VRRLVGKVPPFLRLNSRTNRKSVIWYIALVRIIRRICIIMGTISKIYVIIVVQKLYTVSLTRNIGKYGIYYCDHCPPPFRDPSNH
jgi:hypothetical protein